MQQTEKYKLNLIETSDSFSPQALNENTQKVEAALLAHGEEVQGELAAMGAQTDDLDARVTALEIHKIYFGTYKGNGQLSRFINLGYTPAAVLLHTSQAGGHDAIVLAGQDTTSIYNNDSMAARIVENGFMLGADTYNYNTSFFNDSNKTFCYVAFT